jgi:hypothetical protein
VFFLALFYVSAAVPNPVPRTDSLSIAKWPWLSSQRGASGQF